MLKNVGSGVILKKLIKLKFMRVVMEFFVD